MNKTIGFYGHSDCAYRGTNSHMDILANRLKMTIVNTGVKQGSEERILYELKKTRPDLAIIFHSEPQYQFLPDCDRDIGLNHLKEHRAEYIFENWANNFEKIHNHKFLKKFQTPQNLITAIQTYKDYYYNSELQMNRFTGALIQIDGFLTAKSISSIHIINNSIPNWFKFTSGIINCDINSIIVDNRIAHGTFNVNRITDHGNQLVADRLTELVESLTPSPGVVA